MNASTWVPLVVAVLSAAALVAVAWLQTRKTKQSRDATAVDILRDVNEELRIELSRVADDRASQLQLLKGELARKDVELAQLASRLQTVREEADGAHQTTGRVVRRCEYLEAVIRKHGIVEDPGPLA